ncbi:MAG TPA: hypothetical protein DD730_18790 [Desulfosporosinus sp.]|nr:hypothetical protein [Desulfosporosinus sp.]
MVTRLTLDETFLKVARIMAERGTCARRKVGCVLVNALGHVLATGYNGVANGMDHCIDKPCPGADKKSGSSTSLYQCEAIHAEQNVLLQCKDVQEIDTCYVTCSPCTQCTKLLLNTGCKKVIFIEESSHNEEAASLWFKSRLKHTISISEESVYDYAQKERVWRKFSWKEITIQSPIIIDIKERMVTNE